MCPSGRGWSELTFDIIKACLREALTQVDQSSLRLAPREATGVGCPDALGCHGEPLGWVRYYGLMSPPLVPARTAAAVSYSHATRRGPLGCVLLPEGRGEIISSEQVKHSFQGNPTGGGGPPPSSHSGEDGPNSLLWPGSRSSKLPRPRAQWARTDALPRAQWGL